MLFVNFSQQTQDTLFTAEYKRDIPTTAPLYLVPKQTPRHSTNMVLCLLCLCLYRAARDLDPAYFLS